MESGRSKLWQIALICSALVAMTLAALWPVRVNDFINYDDQEYIYENPHVQAGLTWSGVHWAFTTSHASNWHPLTWLSHMLDVQMFGLRPGPHHLASVALHIANTLLLLILLFRLTARLWASAFVAALFALHPLHVESVAWAAERKDVLSAFFFFLTLLAYGRYAKVRSSEPKPKRQKFDVQNRRNQESKQQHEIRNTQHAIRTLPASIFYALSLIFFVLGLLSKPMLVTVPFVLLLLDYWPLKRFELDAKNSRLKTLLPLLVEKAPFLVLSIASSIVTILVQQRAMVVYKAMPFPYRAANAAVAYVRYLSKTIWPRDLAIMYPHPGAWPVSQIFGAVILLLLITGLCVWLGRARPWLLVGWLWFIGMLVPVIGLIQVGVQAMADRYTYLPLIGLFILITWQVSEWAAVSKNRLRFAATLAGMVLAACAIQTHTQATTWKNTETVFTHDLEVAPDSWVAHHNLAFLALDRYQKTERGTVESQGLDTGRLHDPSAPRRDYLQEVIDHCQAALTIKPTIAEIHVTLAKALTEQGKLDEARSHLGLAIHADPKNAQAKQTLAEILHRQGHAGEAAATYRATLELEPDWGPVLNNLAWLLATCRDDSVRNGPEAVRLAERVCNSTQHTNFWYLHTLAAAYAEAGDFTNAIVAADEARKLTEGARNPALINKATSRLELYRAGRPLRDP